MKIGELFVKPIDRPIEGVIKADDERNLLTEVEEYVVTGEVAKGLSQLIERYLDELSSNGVWLSGFFGSGKATSWSGLVEVPSPGAKNSSIALPSQNASLWIWMSVSEMRSASFRPDFCSASVPSATVFPDHSTRTGSMPA